jgi:hypothetical protein
MKRIHLSLAPDVLAALETQIDRLASTTGARLNRSQAVALAIMNWAEPPAPDTQQTHSGPTPDTQQTHSGHTADTRPPTPPPAPDTQRTHSGHTAGTQVATPDTQQAHNGHTADTRSEPTRDLRSDLRREEKIDRSWATPPKGMGGTPDVPPSPPDSPKKVPGESALPGILQRLKDEYQDRYDNIDDVLRSVAGGRTTTDSQRINFLRQWMHYDMERRIWAFDTLLGKSPPPGFPLQYLRRLLKDGPYEGSRCPPNPFPDGLPQGTAPPDNQGVPPPTQRPEAPRSTAPPGGPPPEEYRKFREQLELDGPWPETG